MYCNKCGKEFEGRGNLCNECQGKKGKMKDWQKILIAIGIIFILFFAIAKISDYSDQKSVERAGREWAEEMRKNNKQ